MWPRLQIDLKYLLVRQVLLFFFLCRSLILEFQRNRRENQINNKTNDWNVLTTFPVKINTKNRRTVLICVAVMWQKTIKIHPHVFIFRFVAGCFFSAVFFLLYSCSDILPCSRFDENKKLRERLVSFGKPLSIVKLLIRLMPLMVMLS